MNPRLAGALDALKGDDAPADRREPIPFDGLDRLAYWRGKREAERDAEQNSERTRERLGRTLAARDPGYPARAFTVDISTHRAVKRAHDLPGSSSRPTRESVLSTSARGAKKTETATRSRLQTEVGR